MQIIDNIPDWLFIVAAAGIVFFPQIKSFLSGILSSKKELPQPGLKAALDSLYTHVAVNCDKADRTACLDALDILREKLIK